jgi:hypothetical protein
MIKINRKGVDIAVVYYNDLNQRENGANVFCKDVDSAKELVKTLRTAIKRGYGFAKVRAITEGDTLD